MLQQLLAIGRNTFTESIRQPIYLVLLLCGILAVLYNTVSSAYTFREDNAQMVVLSMSTLLLIAAALAALTASGAIAQEIERRTALTVVSKPVPRPLFVLGKFAGVMAAVAMAHYVLTLVVVLCVRHGVMITASDRFDGPVWVFGVGGAVLAAVLATAGNYLYRWVFTSTFVMLLTLLLTAGTLLVLVIDHDWQFQSPLTQLTAGGQSGAGTMAQVLVWSLLVLEAAAVVTAVAVAASTRLSTLVTLLLCIGLVLASPFYSSFSRLVDAELASGQALAFGDSLRLIATADVGIGSKAVFYLGKLLYLVLPNFQYFFPADAYLAGFPIPGGHVAWVSMYAGAYVVAALAAGVALFLGREVG